MKFNLKKLAGSLALLSALGASSAANAVSVGLELVLLVDVSGSVSASEYALQKQGYVNAFNNAAVQNAIAGSQGGAIAVTYVEWSGASQFSQLVGWTLINSAASANSFASALTSATRAFAGSTAIQSSIYGSTALFGTETGSAGNGFESMRQVIDVSGDGARNDGLTGTAGRDYALSRGVDTINGIFIAGESGLANYYNNYVKGGTNAFVEQADSFDDFGRAIQNKLVKEISNQVPEPVSLALFGLGLLGLGASRRRKA